MLLWLIEAAGVNKRLVSAAKREHKNGASMMQQSAIIRRVVPWVVVATALWSAVGRTDPSEKLRRSVA
jgi:hypothetical protein